MEANTPLGAFSVSLAVSDLAASQTFYETLGFEVVGGDAEQNWLILANGLTVIGLFHGMFDSNILTFNPGMSQMREQGEPSPDVREIQAAVEAAGYEPVLRAEGESGPAHFVVVDPDGNQIMFDQHA